MLFRVRAALVRYAEDPDSPGAVSYGQARCYNLNCLYMNKDVDYFYFGFILREPHEEVRKARRFPSYWKIGSDAFFAILTTNCVR
ncbi:unnamed protein product [Amoebophrya sp. A120]|nr:unnamed protein product [Amoebophrya sp. A120]|eukprot:GSA120T00025668001.1